MRVVASRQVVFEALISFVVAAHCTFVLTARQTNTAQTMARGALHGNRRHRGGGPKKRYMLLASLLACYATFLFFGGLASPRRQRQTPPPPPEAIADDWESINSNDLGASLDDGVFIDGADAAAVAAAADDGDDDTGGGGDDGGVVESTSADEATTQAIDDYVAVADEPLVGRGVDGIYVAPPSSPLAIATAAHYKRVLERMASNNASKKQTYADAIAATLDGVDGAGDAGGSGAGDGRGVVMITLLDSGFVPAVLNFFHSTVLPLGLQNFLPIATDAGACTRLNAHGVPCYNHGEASGVLATATAVVFESKEFAIKTIEKTKMLLRALDLGYTCFLVDADILFFRSPVAHFNDVVQCSDCDFVIQDDSPGAAADKRNFNSGFIYARPTKRARQLMKLTVDMATAGKREARNDQVG
jgi:hypothetical protein